MLRYVALLVFGFTGVAPCAMSEEATLVGMCKSMVTVSRTDATPPSLRLSQLLHVNDQCGEAILSNNISSI